MKLRTHLITLVLIALLPVLLLTGTLLVTISNQRNQSVMLGLSGTTRALAAALDERVHSVINSLRVIAALEPVDTPDHSAFYEMARRIARNKEGWHKVLLLGPRGEVLVDTSRPLEGAQSETKYVSFVRSTGPWVSGYQEVIHPPEERTFLIGVPIKGAAGERYLVIVAISLNSLNGIFKNQGIPSNWTGAILDADATIIGRSRSPEIYVGHKATAVLASRVKESLSATFEDRNQEGQLTFGAFSRSRSTGWSVVLAVPASTINSSLWLTFGTLIVGGLILLTLGIVLAAIFGRRIARPIVELSEAAEALGSGDAMKPIRSSVTEVTTVAQALRNAAQERARAEAALRGAIQVRDTFLSIASHELKTPLTALQLQIQLLKRKTQKEADAPSVETPIDRMVRQVARLARLIDELLDVSRITSGRLELHSEELDLAALVRETAAQFEAESERSGSLLRIQAELPVPGRWDRSRLEQILTNLISNAIKYGAGKPVEITVISEEPSSAAVEVRDSGIGIAKEDQARIFERFERAAPSISYGGLGLGLWITERLVQALGGTIQVQSAPGQGSCFTVRLPR